MWKPKLKRLNRRHLQKHRWHPVRLLPAWTNPSFRWISRFIVTLLMKWNIGFFFYLDTGLADRLGDDAQTTSGDRWRRWRCPPAAGKAKGTFTTLWCILTVNESVFKKKKEMLHKVMVNVLPLHRKINCSDGKWVIDTKDLLKKLRAYIECQLKGSTHFIGE